MSERYTEKTLKVITALTKTGLWRPAGNNEIWTEKYPFSSGMSNQEIFIENGWTRESGKTFCTKDGMIKGEKESIENMSNRGCVIDGIMEVNNRHVFTEFKLGDHTRFDGNDSIDIITGNMDTIEDFLNCISVSNTTLGYVSVHYNPQAKGMLYSLWQVNISKLFKLLASEELPLPKGERIVGERFYNVPKMSWDVAKETTPQSVFFLKKSRRTKKDKYGNVLRDENNDPIKREYVSLRFKPSSLIKWVWTGKYDSRGKKIYVDDENSVHTKTASILKKHRAIVRTTVGVQTATRFKVNNNLKESLKKQMIWMFGEDWE